MFSRCSGGGSDRHAGKSLSRLLLPLLEGRSECTGQKGLHSVGDHRRRRCQYPSGSTDCRALAWALSLRAEAAGRALPPSRALRRWWSVGGDRPGVGSSAVLQGAPRHRTHNGAGPAPNLLSSCLSSGASVVGPKELALPVLRVQVTEPEESIFGLEISPASRSPPPPPRSRICPSSSVGGGCKERKEAGASESPTLSLFPRYALRFSITLTRRLLRGVGLALPPFHS